MFTTRSKSVCGYREDRSFVTYAEIHSVEGKSLQETRPVEGMIFSFGERKECKQVL